MSSVAYGAITRKRTNAAAGTSKDKNPPGVSTYVDALVALVPAEVLAAETFIVSRATKSTIVHHRATTVFTQPTLMKWTLIGLCLISMLLFVAGRVSGTGDASKWEGLDSLRMCVPPLALIGWTALQKPSLLSAFWSTFTTLDGEVIGVLGAVALATVSTLLGGAADTATPGKRSARRPLGRAGLPPAAGGAKK